MMVKARSVFLVLLALLSVSPALAQQATQAPTQAATQMANTINLGSSKDFPKILVGPNGMTLYIFTVDTLGQSNCNDKCATFWPPLTVASADQLTVANGIPGQFGTITRKDGTIQVTDNGMPLYYWSKDKNPGDTTGNRVTRNWWVVPPATVSIYHDPKLGSILSGPTGLTLYTFTKDSAGTSTCTGDCAKAWPPLTVTSADQLVPGVNLPGKFDTIKRDDGSLQVTYNGWPLYTFAKDKAPGDTQGEGVGKVWYSVVPETIATASTSALGTFLVSYDGMTLYTFSKDTAGVSNCTGDCAKAWPPFTVYPADRLAAVTGVSGKLGTITRDDKTVQVTYNGMPLYLFGKDQAPGDANGQGVGNVWAVVKP